MRVQTFGFSTSLLVHGLFGLLLFSLATGVPEAPAPKVIDLSILAGPKSAPSPAVAAPPEPVARVVPTLPVAPEVVKQEVIPPRKQKKVVKRLVRPIPEAVKIPAPVQVAAVEVEEPSAPIVSETPEPQALTSTPSPPAQSTMARSEGVASAQAQDSPVAVASGGTGTAQTAEERWRQEHFDFIKEAIRKNMTYPVIARKNGWQGRVLVSFVICQDGQVKDIRIEKSSGFALLDKNSVSIIKQSAPFPNPPVQATLIVPIDYTLG
ncbi:MAG: TonB family protein [Proteobacteria bacterium]|nr:energy transducer TonB [Desulfobulbaceae bacterium]MBU4152684.1 TonB family protein [Pseudomonadota bacterium]MDP2106286.1 TonB family protein [Desulfobulbaceae bacterium]